MPEKDCIDGHKHKWEIVWLTDEIQGYRCHFCKEEELDINERYCVRCGKSFTPEEWENRHDAHEPACISGGWEDCDCDLVYHEKCCSICNPKDATQNS